MTVTALRDVREMSDSMLAGFILLYDAARAQGRATEAMKERQEAMLDELVRRGHIESYSFVAA